jgi:hypothetical protein
MHGKTILAIHHHCALTSAELERLAYIQGKGLLACYAAETDELEEQVDGFDDLVDTAKSDALRLADEKALALQLQKSLKRLRAI